jgi:hypothetical protein
MKRFDGRAINGIGRPLFSIFQFNSPTSLDIRSTSDDKPVFKSARTLNMDLRVIMKIEVLPEARDGVEAVWETLGMTHVSLNTR